MRNDDFSSNVDEFANTVIECIVGANPHHINWDRFNPIINRRSEQLFCAAGYADNEADDIFRSGRDTFYTDLAEMILDLHNLFPDVPAKRFFDLVWKLLEQAYMESTTSREAAESLFLEAIRHGEAPVLRRHLLESWRCAAHERQGVGAG